MIINGSEYCVLTTNFFFFINDNCYYKLRLIFVRYQIPKKKGEILDILGYVMPMRYVPYIPIIVSLIFFL